MLRVFQAKVITLNWPSAHENLNPVQTLNTVS